MEFNMIYAVLPKGQAPFPVMPVSRSLSKAASEAKRRAAAEKMNYVIWAGTDDGAFQPVREVAG